MKLIYDDLELGVFSDNSYVVKQHKSINALDVLETASLEDRLNTPVDNLVISKDYCRYIKTDDFNKDEYGEYCYRLGFKKGKGAIAVWVVSVLEVKK